MQTFDRIVLDSAGSSNDGPSSYAVFASNNPSDFGDAFATGSGDAVTSIEFAPTSARYIRIEQNGTKGRYWWSIHELSIFQPG